MKCFGRTLLSQLNRVIISKTFACACLGALLLNLLCVWDEMQISSGTGTVQYFYELATFYSLWILFTLFGALPGATQFCSDYDSKYFRFSAMRCSKKNYGAVTAAAAFISSVLVVFVGEWLFIIALSFFYPLYSQGSGMSLKESVFKVCEGDGGVYVYFLIRILFKGFCAGFLSVAALFVSTKITNIFVALSSPIIVYFTLENLLFISRAPYFLQIGNIVKGHLQMEGNLFAAVAYPLAVFAGLSLIFGILFTALAKRRIENG